MEMDKAQFAEKLKALLDLAKKKKMFWNTRRSTSFSRESH